MKSHVVRLYALAVTLTVFFLSWAVIAAKPWQGEPAAGSDLRLAQLAAREAQLRREASRVQLVLDRRFAGYRAALSRRQEQNQAIQEDNAEPAAAPQVTVLPAGAQPVTATSSS